MNQKSNNKSQDLNPDSLILELTSFLLWLRPLWDVKFPPPEPCPLMLSHEPHVTFQLARVFTSLSFRLRSPQGHREVPRPREDLQVLQHLFQMLLSLCWMLPSESELRLGDSSSISPHTQAQFSQCQEIDISPAENLGLVPRGCLCTWSFREKKMATSKLLHQNLPLWHLTTFKQLLECRGQGVFTLTSHPEPRCPWRLMHCVG